jgi:hypothetical protein
MYALDMHEYSTASLLLLWEVPLTDIYTTAV